MRIAVGGFQHETNTFAPVKADFESFARAGGWPALAHGPAMLEAVDGVHIPITGAVTALTGAGAELVPLSWAAATPSAHVTENAYERIATALVEGLERAIAAEGPVDGLYLDLHGAMVTEHLEDGEGELLRRFRDLLGPDVPIAVSLDLHANVTEAMVAHADLIDIYRTYPHVDMGETGARTALHLLEIARTHRRPAKSLRKLDFLIPLNWGCTELAPMDRLYGKTLPGMLDRDPGLRALAIACGFPQADIREVGPAILAYAEDQRTADAAADALADAMIAAKPEFGEPIYPPDAAVRRAMEIVADGARKPVVIADTQDNPGGGGPGDTTGMLRALLDAGAQGAVLAMLIDPESAALAHATGVGGDAPFALGGRHFPGDRPVEAAGRVVSLGDGRFTATGPMWGGARMELGPMALIEVAGVRVVLASRSEQAGDQSMLRHLGLEPADQPILVLKSSVHFRADFQPIASAVLTAAAPGPVIADPATLDYKHIRDGVRRRPDL
ncbi:M81 family metallopeptidase [Marivibrio halodurans]|uniref:Microcystinase C n=1 Tax=Marivibrio halodurans TaxID=2039722 RepID=A0A8J7V3S6_9PROT|nr:M81 family metallopeptidase [Marivibrio halodurans]MBP5856984.1 M81 family metallopeptidase [Marivibrio halodurans]